MVVLLNIILHMYTLMDKSRTFDIRVSIEDEELISVKKENRRVNYNEIVGDFRMWMKKKMTIKTNYRYV